MANYTMNQLNPQGLTTGIPRPPMSPMSQMSPQQDNKNEWLRALLIGATLFGGMAGQKKGGQKAAPGGFKAPEKPLLAQSFHALAQGIEQKAKGEQMLKQAQKEQKQKQEKETFERQFKMYVEQMKGERAKADIASREKIAGMRTTPEEPSEFELTEQTKQLEIMDAQIANYKARTFASNALGAKRLKETEGIDVDFGDIDRLIEKTEGNKTVGGQQIKGGILEAWNTVIANGFTDLSPLYRIQTGITDVGIKTYQTESITEFEGEERVTQKTQPAPDYENNKTLIEGMIKKAEGIAGKRPITEEHKADILRAAERADETSLNMYIGIYGYTAIENLLLKTKREEGITPVVGGAGQGR